MKLHNQKVPELPYAAVCATGLYLSLYSVLLKISGIPCLTDACREVIQSRYGEVLGVPVGLFAMIFWMLLLYPASSLGVAARAALGIGSVFFVSVQAFVLHQFCLICCLHAGACLAIVLLKAPARAVTPWGYLAIVAALLTLIGTDRWTRKQLREGLLAEAGAPRQPVTPLNTFARKIEERDRGELGRNTALRSEKRVDSPPQPTSQAPQESPLTQDPARGFPWLAAHSLKQTRLVISLSCHHCLRLMERVLAEGMERKAGARILLLINSKNRAMTRTFVAALLSSQTRPPHIAFRKAFGITLREKEALLAADAEAIRAALETGFPRLDLYRAAANRLLLKQQVYLRRIGLPGTPSLINEKDQPAPLEADHQVAQPLPVKSDPEPPRKEARHAKLYHPN